MSATLIQGSSATLSVTRAGLIVNSGVSAWIDYNRNGIFETSERVMAVNATNTVATASILVPATALLGSTRMRVMAFGGSTIAPTNPCVMNQFNMEVEDYTINIQTNLQPPLVDLIADNPITCNGQVQFSDNSVNIPTSWTWNFGDPSSGANNTSTLQNPTHTYAATGQYTVTLTACNSFGCNTTTKTNYINHDPANAFCTNVIMPSSGVGPTATLCSGTIYDPGGPTGQYPNDANGITTIAPSGGGTVTLTFTSFDLESGWDFLRVYDGPSTSSPLLASLTNNIIPTPITSTGSALTLQFTSDPSVSRDGFAATWTCSPVTAPPVANLKADLTNICTGVVAFQDLSTNSPTSWTWDFGDGSPTSNLKNPTHTYSTTTASSYTVILTSCNSFGCNTVTKTSYVNIDIPCRTYCASNGHNNSRQWISNLTLGSINNNSGPDVNGYGNFTYLVNNIMLGTATNPVSVSLGNNSGTFAFAAIWIDFNKDGIFQATERVFNEQGQSTGFGTPMVASGNINIPGTASLGRTRMRVIISQNSNLTDPCIMNQFMGETEDYTINIQPNTLPTIADFTADLNTICTGVVQFNDASTNGATSWTWNFGDGTPTSNLQNPAHTYATGTAANYNVTLTACKGTQCSTVTKNNFINITVPCLTYCASAGHNNGIQWISNVNMGTINNTTAADPNGYGNYIYLSTNPQVGSSTPISVTLGNNNGPFGRVAIWVDFNKDGTFASTEKVLDVQAQNTGFGNPLIASGSILVPNTASTGRTRMRVILTQNFSLNDPCIMNQFMGETEDYTINVQPNTLPTVADFTANLNTICTGVVQFNDASTNGATSWTWNFGDGTPTSNLQNPTHTYATGTAANFNVTLTACKGTQCSTTTKNNFISIDVPCRNYCASTGHNNTNQWISNVTLGTINNTSVADPNGYGNFTYLSSNLTLGTATNPVSVTLGNNFGFNGFIVIWIDFNKDGVFQTTERVLNQQANFGNPMIASGNIIVPSTALIGRTRMRVILTQTSNMTNPCIMNQFLGETEDYSINIQPNTLPTVADFTANLNAICTGVVQFNDASTNGATSWTWNFGDGTPTSNLQNPTHTYATGTAANYNVTLTACKGTQCSTTTKNNFVNITVPCRNYCASSGHNNSNQWIGNVQLSNINNATSADANGYGNYTYLSANIMLGTPSTPVTVTLGNNNGFNGNIAIWIDFNKDGTFQATERVFNQQGISGGFGLPIIATGNITMPATASVGTTRMRVIMSQNFSLNDPCIMNQFIGETEDYTVNIQPNTLPTVADFTANLSAICTGVVQFNDASTNGATSWTWNFGDGTPTSNLQNPTHTYATGTAANYNVTLTACKGTQCSTVTKNNYITISVPCLNYCASTNHINTNQWISNVTLGTINNNTAADLNGYGNYTYLSSNLSLGTATNPVTVTLGTNFTFGFVAAWIDFNKDGTFAATERVFNVQATSPGFGSPMMATGNISVPGTALIGRTRMRVIFSQNTSLTNPCIMSQFNTETEDYSVNIQPNTLPTVADFTANLNAICTGVVQFNDASTNGATSWTWNFGDGTPTSNLQNPTHTYAAGTAASYNVTLTACKGTQCNTITKNNFVNITVPCLNYCASSGHNNANQWISNVTMGTINNTTAADVNAYGNYTYLRNSVLIGSFTNPISVTLGNNTGAFRNVAIWIDLNRDGTFAMNEQVFNQLATSASFGNPLIASGNISIPATATIGITRMRVIMTPNSTLNTACIMNQFEGETEDYTINILPTTVPPIVNFSANPRNTCNGQVAFTDLSQNNANSWTWNFGDGTPTSSLQNPSHTYSGTGTYTVSLTACNSFGCNTFTQNNYITYDPTSAACNTVNMPINNTTVTATNCSGTVYDDGGAVNPYSHNGRGIVVIAPTNARTVSLNFTVMDMESCCDFLKVYDGNSTSAPLLRTLTGNFIPTPISSTGGALTLEFFSDFSVNGQGWAATWNCTTSIGIAKDDVAPAAFEVYPNPSTGLVNLRLKNKAKDDYQMEVTNVLGQVLMQKGLTLSDKEQTLDLSSFPKGVYFIKVVNKNTTETRRIVLD
jgi:PKD repeat protein